MFGNPLDADQAFFVTTSTISWIIDLDYRLGLLWFPSLEDEFLVGGGSMESFLLWLYFQGCRSDGSVPALWVKSLYSGQIMHRKPSDKLQVVQTHFKLLSTLSIVFVTEGDFLFIYIQNSMVGDGHFPESSSGQVVGVST